MNPLCRISNPAAFGIRICNPLSFFALQMLILIAVGFQIRPSGISYILVSVAPSGLSLLSHHYPGADTPVCVLSSLRDFDKLHILLYVRNSDG